MNAFSRDERVIKLNFLASIFVREEYFYCTQNCWFFSITHYIQCNVTSCTYYHLHIRWYRKNRKKVRTKPRTQVLSFAQCVHGLRWCAESGACNRTHCTISICKVITYSCPDSSDMFKLNQKSIQFKND
mgnify:CR=1 FL=1